MSHTQKTKPVIDYTHLTEAERRIIAWVRHGTSNNCDWMGTIRFVNGPNIVQLSEHVKAGQVKR